MTDHIPTPVSLEQQLRSLGDRDGLFPETPELASDIAGLIRLRDPESTSRRFGLSLDRPLRVAALVALALLAALVAALAVPSSRTAIADFFGLEGIRIEFGQDDDNAGLPATPASIGGSLLLGERSTMDEVIRTVPFDVALPTDDAASEPDEIYLNQRSGVIVVGLLYEASDELPEIGSTGVGMLVLEIDSANAGIFFVKKTVVGGGEVEMTSINGSTAYWIEDGILTVAPVEGLMLDPPGMDSRRSGNVLIWSDGDVTYRLETDLPINDAVRIAGSLAPVVEAGNRLP